MAGTRAGTGGLHVCLLFEFPTQSGGEQSMLALIDGARDRVRFSALAPPGALSDELTARGVTVRHIKLRNGAAVTETLAALGPDLVHANSLSASVALGRLMTMGFPYRTTGHVRDIMNLSSARADAVCRLDHLLAVSQATAESLIAQGVARGRIAVVRNGIDADGGWNPDRWPRGTFRVSLGIDDDARVIGTIGQICLRKDQMTFLAGTLPLLDGFADVQLVVVGERWSEKDESREFEAALHAAIPDQHRHRVHFTGWRDDTAAVLRDLDIVVSTARQEPFGRVLLEASAMARPVIATDVGGTREIIIGDVTGKLIPPDDADAVTTRCREWLLDMTAANETGLRARDHVAREFPVDRMVAGVLRVWDV